MKFFQNYPIFNHLQKKQYERFLVNQEFAIQLSVAIHRGRGERERESFKTKYGDTENIKQNLLTCTQLSTNRVLKKQLKDQLHHITILRIMEKELKIRPQHKHKFLQYSVGVVQLE